MTLLDPVRDIPSYAVIIRCIHCRGEQQAEALVELNRRGLWLSDEQKIQAGLASPTNGHGARMTNDEEYESDDLAPARGCFNALAITFITALAIWGITLLIWQ